MRKHRQRRLRISWWRGIRQSRLLKIHGSLLLIVVVVGVPRLFADSEPTSAKEKTDVGLWCLKRLQRSPLPSMPGDSGSRDPIDLYVREKLQAGSLQFNSEADDATLLRRLSIDLSGLTPSSEEIDPWIGAKLSEVRPDSYERWVDRLLASPRFGERWGRHWLDLTQYADSIGVERIFPNENAWRFRDFVIDAFNRGMPFDRFVMMQIAGDILPADSVSERAEQILATQFLTMVPANLVNQFKEQLRMDIVDSQVDKIGRVFMGLTLSCARCHDHKFDPVSQTDYYALAGILHNVQVLDGLLGKSGVFSDWHRRPIPETDQQRRMREEAVTRHDQALAERRADIEKKKNKLALAQNNDADEETDGDEGTDASEEEPVDLNKLKAEIERLEKDLVAFDKLQAPQPRTALAASEPDQVVNARVNIRGNPLQLGKEVPRGIPTVLAGAATPEIAHSDSGRVELARWLVSPENTAVPRVFANRIWHHLFGRGIVATVDNFGELGDKPSHPELLDHLAARLIDTDWNVKLLIRKIVCGSTYRLASDFNDSNWSIDPDNRLLWRHSPRRIDAETLRDSLLRISGQLNSTMAGSTLPPANWLAGPITDFAQIDNVNLEPGDLVTRRSIYLPVTRTPTKFKVQEPLLPFDLPPADEIVGARATSTAATQTLYLLNSDFTQSVALRLAAQLQSHDTLSNDASRIQSVYRAAYARKPTEAELQTATEFLHSSDAAVNRSTDEAKTSPLAQFCHAILISTEFLIHD